METTTTYVETTKVPSTTYKTVCHTVPVETYTESVCTKTKEIPTETVIEAVKTKTKEVPSVIHTSKPYPKTITSVSYSTYTSLCPETSSTCYTKTGWKTWTAKGGW